MTGPSEQLLSGQGRNNSALVVTIAPHGVKRRDATPQLKRSGRLQHDGNGSRGATRRVASARQQRGDRQCLGTTSTPSRRTVHLRDRLSRATTVNDDSQRHRQQLCQPIRRVSDAATRLIEWGDKKRSPVSKDLQSELRNLFHIARIL